MAEECITYQPYRSQGFLIPFLHILNGFCLFLMGYFAVEGIWAVLVILAGGAFFLAWTISSFQRQLNALVLVDEKGISLIGDKKATYRHISWEALSYGYQAANFKNHHFLVLSKACLTEKQAKSLANRSANHSQMYMEGSVVLYLDSMQDTTPLMDRVSRHICFPDTQT